MAVGTPERGDGIGEDPPGETRGLVGPQARRDRSDELLGDEAILATLRPPSALTGYAAGRRSRRFVYGVLAVAAVGAVVSGTWVAKGVLEAERLAATARETQPTLNYDVDPTVSRADELTWTAGVGRFALRRASPALLRIRLPDRILQLQEGSERAWLTVHVENGRTTEVKVLSGAVDTLAPKGFGSPAPPAR